MVTDSQIFLWYMILSLVFPILSCYVILLSCYVILCDIISSLKYCVIPFRLSDIVLVCHIISSHLSDIVLVCAVMEPMIVEH